MQLNVKFLWRTPVKFWMAPDSANYKTKYTLTWRTILLRFLLNQCWITLAHNETIYNSLHSIILHQSCLLLLLFLLKLNNWTFFIFWVTSLEQCWETLKKIIANKWGFNEGKRMLVCKSVKFDRFLYNSHNSFNPVLVNLLPVSKSIHNRWEHHHLILGQQLKSSYRVGSS